MESLGWLPLLAGLAIRSAIQRAGVDAVLKWPNDVLAPVDGERKLCGILCELAPGPAPGWPSPCSASASTCTRPATSSRSTRPPLSPSAVP
ncbi:hypothetical protein GCM10025862_23800 [Arsenicicoccus piscis]|uniref:BPL/LPL catalytic domain-containing protein n=1 Tax=Arsenicicoccus piscis TaxID=673954 RepID=A0ABQ6HS64_9MICO|nr:hypothetical protein GCM10025862_23800 [Arsenicicoccus piscis]